MSRTDVVPDTSRPPGRSRRTAWIASVAGAVVLLAGTFTYFNTNVLTPDRICHGWVTPVEAADAMGGGPGRVTARDGSDTTCVIHKANWLPGSADKHLELSTETEDTTFPFYSGVWEISAVRHVMTGGIPGAFDNYGGWALLPESCTEVVFGYAPQHPQPVLRAYGFGSEGEAAGIGPLLASAARAIISGPKGCAAAGVGEEPTRFLSTSGPRTTDFDKVCGIPGFRLAKMTGPKGQRVLERTSGSLKDGLYCDLSFEGDKEGPFDRLAVVNDAALVDILKSRKFDRVNCGGRPTVLAYDWGYADEAELARTGRPDAAGLAKAFSGAAREALHCE
ncbi:hypothetical protein [Streptomyces sp. NPDC088725]|uniref:hypothetical protein n=1 Tax=Streptomyces sp. NPDC088725 TaxID=3365873 RepID=UPI0037FB5CD8